MPTRSWVVLGAVLGAMWYAAVSQGNSAAYLLMFFLASLVMVSAVHGHFALTHLQLRVGRLEPVFVGEPVRVKVEVMNLSGRARPTLFVAPSGHVFKEHAHISVPHLDSHGSQDVHLALPTSRRGRFRVERLVITTTYPMGFFRAWSYAGTDASCLVYPRPHGTMPLPTGPAFSAEVPSGTGLGGDDYTGARPYQTGESQRHVDWRAVARGQPLLVKQFSGSGSRRLLFDYAETSNLGDAGARLAQLSRWIVDADNDGFAYGLRIPGFSVEPARGRAHFHRCMGALALFDEASGEVVDH